jgi:hypothetical protein
VALLAVIAGLALFDPMLAPLAPPIAPWAQRALRHELLRRHRHRLRRHPLLRGPAGRGEAEQVRLNQRLLVYLRSVAAVTSAATKVEAGTFDPASLDEVGRRTDALGNLARLFQHMGVEVAARERRLREQVRLFDHQDRRAKEGRTGRGDHRSRSISEHGTG